MLLVLSEEIDISTDKFMEWCEYHNKDVIRLNVSRESINNLCLVKITDDNIDIQFDFKGVKVNLNDIESIWFRRGELKHLSEIQIAQYLNFNIENKPISDFFEYESKTLDEFILTQLKTKLSLGDPERYNANKLIALKTALDVGLQIPNSIITTKWNEVEQFFVNKNDVITKPIQDSHSIVNNTYRFVPVVQQLSVNKHQKFQKFYYSIIQERIEKKYELRIFFIKTQFYAGCIFSQSDGVRANLKIDKIVPFQLPDLIKRKLILFTQKMNFNTGSIDMIVDRNNNYYFLEINPAGQYDFLSVHCNYYLDYKIFDFFEK